MQSIANTFIPNGEMIIVIGNVHDDLSSNPRKAVCIYRRTFLFPDIGK